MVSGLNFMQRMIIFLPNLQFAIQGSQKIEVRVPISQKDSDEGFQFPTRIVGKMTVVNALVSKFLGI